jgi:hypothetical protein
MRYIAIETSAPYQSFQKSKTKIRFFSNSIPNIIIKAGDYYGIGGIKGIRASGLTWPLIGLRKLIAGPTTLRGLPGMTILTL